jgi:hypothetical protein
MEWILHNESLLVGLGIFSVACFVASLVGIPFLIARVDSDYFLHPHPLRPPGGWTPWRALRSIAKNLVGLLLVLAGLLMLVLPGQGVLTLLVGVLLMDFPGKFALQQWLVRRRSVLRALNWMRRRAGKPPLRVDGSQEASDESA